MRLRAPFSPMSLSLYFTIDLRHLRDDDQKSVVPDIIQFWARPFLEKEHRELMQAHFGLTEEEQKEKQHEYNAALLAKIAHRAPKGLPGFPEKFDDLETAIFETLAPKTEINEMIAELLISEHLTAGGNRYFFR